MSSQLAAESALKALTPWAERPGLLPDDPMSEAGRKVMAYHLARLLAREPGVRQNADPEAVHDMRVGTRRLRSAVRTLRPFYRRSSVRRIRKKLRRLANALGAVRDLEVFAQKTETYRSTAGKMDQNSVRMLLGDFRAKEDEARRSLLTMLDSPAHGHLIADLVEFVTTPDLGAARRTESEEGHPLPYRARHVAPALIYAQYEAVRAYETVLVAPAQPPPPDAAVGTLTLDGLHALRIEAKRLRYLVEFFQEILDPAAQTLIEAAKKLQDHLGDMQDARVACGLIEDYARRALTPRSRRAALRYLAAREAEKRSLVTGFLAAWEAFTRDEVRRALALAVSIL